MVMYVLIDDFSFYIIIWVENDVNIMIGISSFDFNMDMNVVCIGYYFIGIRFQDVDGDFVMIVVMIMVIFFIIVSENYYVECQYQK